MARKKAAASNGAADVDRIPAAPSVSPKETLVVKEVFDPVKVNNANLTELKIACDDATRRFFGRPEQFRTRHTHTDVRLALGWSAVAVAVATGLYSWKKEFEEAKPLVLIGVALYFTLSALQAAYAYFIEEKTIYVGKRKTLANRIETERISITSETKSPSTASASPAYAITLSFVRSTSGGKTIVYRSESQQERPYTAFFDSEGTLDEQAFITWLRESSTTVNDEKSQQTASR